MSAAAFPEDPYTRHAYETFILSPTAGHQLQDAKLSFGDSKLLHLSTVGKRVLVPRTLEKFIVAMYHESEFYGHSGVLPTRALIDREYVCSYVVPYVERYILSCDMWQAAKSRHVNTASQAAQTPTGARHQMA